MAFASTRSIRHGDGAPGSSISPNGNRVRGFRHLCTVSARMTIGGSIRRGASGFRQDLRIVRGSRSSRLSFQRQPLRPGTLSIAIG